MDISIVIVTWNSQDFIRQCLGSILATSAESGTEVIVVDNASSDGTARIVRASYPEVNLIENKTNLGYAKANNQGIDQAQGRYVLLLNPDTRLLDHSLSSMYKFMERNPRAGAMGPRLLNPDGSTQASCREFPGFSSLIWEFSGLSRLFPESKIFGKWRMGYFTFDQPREVDQPMGSCLVIRKETLEQVGSFDENFSMFFNDVDLCYRIKNAGWKIYFQPDAQVIHHRGAFTRKVKRKMIWLSHLAFYKFFKKHRKGPADRFLLLLFSLPLFLSALPRMLLKR
ncbi:MAG: glycosyltransferase family 2 protein [Candidatus Zixiibacteriota bacterium]|nr:MAG: glycosyltransferase family 2 protein [candidate division Zixibacteria bacterium]